MFQTGQAHFKTLANNKILLKMFKSIPRYVILDFYTSVRKVFERLCGVH